ERVGEQKIMVALLVRLVGAAHDGHEREQLVLVVAQRTQVSRLVALEQPHLTGALGVGAGREQSIVNDVNEVRTGHTLGGPPQLARRTKERDARGTWQERAHEPHVRIEPGAGLPGYVIAVRERIHGTCTLALPVIAVVAQVGESTQARDRALA